MIMKYTKITLNNIKNIKNHIYFDKTIHNYKIINKKIKSRLIILMFHAMLNKSKETLLLFNNKTFHYLISQHCSDFENVFLSENMIDLLTNNEEITYTAIHNHPNNSNFSLADLKQLFSYSKLQMIIVITNDCKNIAAIIKTGQVDFDTSQKLVIGINNYMSKKGVNEHYTAMKLIEYFHNKGMLLYLEKDNK